MEISSVMSAANRFAAYYQNQNQQIKQVQAENKINMEEAYTQRTSSKISGTGRFMRAYGGNGTLEHIDVAV